MKIKILTEECPQPSVVQYILKKLTNSDCSNAIITDCVNGEFHISNVPNHDIYICLFKGNTSSVDYIVYLDNDETPCLLIEATKTTDTESRNTSAYQRLIKFIIAKMYYPNAELVMFYEKTFDTKITSTMVMGIRLAKTIGVNIIGPNGQNIFEDILSFTCVNDIIKQKNIMKQNKGNVSVVISNPTDHSFVISAKLEKSGTFGHDPNKGLVSALCFCIHKFDENSDITITQHKLTQDMVKTNSGNKFCYAIRNMNVSFDKLDEIPIGVMPTAYWSPQLVSSEKSASISCHFAMINQGWKCIFHNHVGSARSFLEINATKHIAVPKIFKIPDMVLKRGEEILMIEAKNAKTLSKGDVQLEGLDNFEQLLLLNYVNYTVSRGLCVPLPEGCKIPKTKHDIVYICRY